MIVHFYEKDECRLVQVDRTDHLYFSVSNSKIGNILIRVIRDADVSGREYRYRCIRGTSHFECYISKVDLLKVIQLHILHGFVRY